MGILALGLLGALLAVLFRRGLRRAQDLRGQVAIVTGASRGIGRATALALGAAGMRVVLTAPAAEAEALETIRDELAAAGAVARVVVADITQENDRQRLVVET